MLKRQLKLRLLIYPMLALFLYGVCAYFFTPQIKPLSHNEDTSVNILITTEEPLFISYNPKENQAVVNVLNISKQDLKDNAFFKKPPLSEQVFLILQPKEKNTSVFWEKFKKYLYTWSNRPYLIIAYFYSYFDLRYHKQTDINFATFLMLSWKLTTMQPADFIIKTYEKPKGKKSKKVPPQQQITLGKDISKNKQEDKILVIEVFNASGQKGLAGTLTNYLRDLNNQGIVKVDVINYATYPTTLEETQVIDTSGRMKTLKEILLKIGLDTKEIHTSNDKSVISEAQIILGKDFNMPK
jgi:hypothetical protein